METDAGVRVKDLPPLSAVLEELEEEGEVREVKTKGWTCEDVAKQIHTQILLFVPERLLITIIYFFNHQGFVYEEV